MSARTPQRRPWARLAPVALVVALSTGTPSVADHSDVSGSAAGRLITYFHQTQGNDPRKQNPLCRRQVQEETTGVAWLDKYAYDPPSLTGPQGPQSYMYQRDPYHDYKGTYRIGSAQVGTTTAPAVLTATLRAVTYNGPSGSFAGPECVEPGPAPVLDAVVSGRDADGDELLCKYYDGTWERLGSDPRIVLHGRCTITTAGGAVLSAPVRETRHMTPPQGSPCAPIRPGTGIFGAGDCFYLLSTTVTDDH